jgi:hypothetical protein
MPVQGPPVLGVGPEPHHRGRQDRHNDWPASLEQPRGTKRMSALDASRLIPRACAGRLPVPEPPVGRPRPLPWSSSRRDYLRPARGSLIPNQLTSSPDASSALPGLDWVAIARQPSRNSRHDTFCAVPHNTTLLHSTTVAPCPKQSSSVEEQIDADPRIRRWLGLPGGSCC